MPEANVQLKFEVVVLDNGQVGVSAPTELLAQKALLLGLLDLAKVSILNYQPKLVQPVAAVPPVNGTAHPPLRRI